MARFRTDDLEGRILDPSQPSGVRAECRKELIRRVGLGPRSPWALTPEERAYAESVVRTSDPD